MKPAHDVKAFELGLGADLRQLLLAVRELGGTNAALSWLRARFPRGRAASQCVAARDIDEQKSSSSTTKKKKRQRKTTVLMMMMLLLLMMMMAMTRSAPHGRPCVGACR